MAAELAPFVRSLPHAASYSQAPTGILWRCDFEVPKQVDAQYPACMWQLMDYLDRQLPALASDHVGGPVERVKPGWLRSWILRKGCYLEADGAAEGDVMFAVQLSGASWPEAWGGHLRAGETILAPVSGAVDLVQHPVSIPLVRRPVEGLLVWGWLRRC